MERVNRVFFERAERILAMKNYVFRHIDKKQLDKYAEDFRVVYNKACWAKTSVRKT